MNKEIKLIDLLQDLLDYLETMPYKLPKRIEFDGEEFIFKTNNYYSIEDGTNIMEYVNHILDLKTIIKILDEENDEFGDIKFEDYGLCWSTDKKEDIDSAFRDFSRAIIYNKELIEKLIRNQKRILERLNKDGKVEM